MLKVRRTEDRDAVFIVSGRLQADNVGELWTLVLDLKDLVLVDRDAVHFLRVCEGDGIVLRNCPPYIRAWMAREGEQP